MSFNILSGVTGSSVPVHYEPSTMKPRSPPPGSKAANRRSTGRLGLFFTRTSPSQSHDATSSTEYPPPSAHSSSLPHGDNGRSDINAAAPADHRRSYSNMSASSVYRAGSFDALGHGRTLSNMSGITVGSVDDIKPVIGWASVEGDAGMYPPAPLYIPPTLYPQMGTASSAVTVAISPTFIEQQFIVENSLVMGPSGIVQYPSLHVDPPIDPASECEALSLQPSRTSEVSVPSSHPSLSRDHSSSFKLSSTVWSVHCTSEGYKYFHNNVTGQTMWESEMTEEDLHEAMVGNKTSSSGTNDGEGMDSTDSAAPPAPSKGKPQWHTAMKKLLWGVKEKSSSFDDGSTETDSEFESDSDEDSTYASSPIHAAPPVSNSPQYEGDTALHAAVSYSYTDDETLEEILVHGGLDVNGANAEGETPMHRAALYAYFVGIELLVRHGADLTARDNNGQTAFHYAAVCGQYSLECIQYLESFCPDGIYVKDHSENSVLHTAAAMGVSGECIQYLASKIDINDVNLDGDTPLHLSFASKAKNSQDLLKAGADITVVNGWGQTPFAAGSLREDGSAKTHRPSSVSAAAAMTSTSCDASLADAAPAAEEERKEAAPYSRIPPRSTTSISTAGKSLYPVITVPPSQKKGAAVDVVKARIKSPTRRTMRGLIRKITGMDKVKRKNQY